MYDLESSNMYDLFSWQVLHQHLGKEVYFGSRYFALKGKGAVWTPVEKGISTHGELGLLAYKNLKKTQKTNKKRRVIHEMGSALGRPG